MFWRLTRREGASKQQIFITSRIHNINTYVKSEKIKRSIAHLTLGLKKKEKKKEKNSRNKTPEKKRKKDREHSHLLKRISPL